MKTVKINTGKKVSADDWVKEREAMKPYVKRKQFSFNLSEDVHHRFDVACTLNNMKMTEVITKAIEQYVRENEKL